MLLFRRFKSSQVEDNGLGYDSVLGVGASESKNGRSGGTTGLLLGLVLAMGLSVGRPDGRSEDVGVPVGC